MTSAASTHLVIADDHPLFRDALRQAVASVVKSAVIDEAGSVEDMTARLEKDSGGDRFRQRRWRNHPPVAGLWRLRLHPQALRGRDPARRHRQGDGGRRL